MARGRRYGQHFLTDEVYVQRMIRAIGAQADDRLVEIGPGRGALTLPLLSRVRCLEAIEIDPDLGTSLQSRAKHDERLHVHIQDALATDFRALCPRPDARLRIVGNLPYQITSPLLFHLIDQIACIRDMVFMVQREVAERIAAEPGASAFGRLSVMIQYHCRASVLFRVPPGAFSPPPKVDSAVVRLVPQQARIIAQSRSTLGGLVAAAFSQRRKTIRNALRSMVTAEDLATLGIQHQRRPQTLSVDEFVSLANHLYRTGRGMETPTD